MQLHNVVWALFISPSKYVQEAVRACKNYVGKNHSDNCSVPNIMDNLLSLCYSLELDAPLVLESA